MFRIRWLSRGERGKVWFVAAVLVAVCAVVILGCGGFGGQGSGGKGGTEEAPELSDPPPIEGEVITEDLGEHTIRLGMGLSETSPTYIAMEHFEEIVETRSDGRIDVQIFPSNQLGSDGDRISAVQRGSQEMDLPDSSPLFTQVPQIGLFDLLYLFPNVEAVYGILDGEVGEELTQAFDGTGMRVLFFAENGYRQLTNNVRPVESLEDVSGMSVRVRENPIQVDGWTALGASPTTLAFGELFSALEQGVVDGQENPWNTIYTSSFYEVQQYATETNHVWSPLPMLISESFWEQLDPQYQRLIEEAADQSGRYQRQISQEYSQAAKDRVIEAGMEVTELNDQQLEAFRDAAQPVYGRWSAEIGEDLVEQVQREAEQYR
jgi:tripartite ATP-independent transporter DctP family solute receptor